MNLAILFTHSILRYVILLLILASIITAFQGYIKNTKYSTGINKLHFISRVALSVQALLGVILYLMDNFVSKVGDFSRLNSFDSFFVYKHVSIMLLAIIFINAGYIKAAKSIDDKLKHKKIAFFYSLGFLLIFFAIPWPFIESFGVWL